MAEGAQSRSDIRRLLSDRGHEPNQNYGQNFLADPGVVADIVSVAQVEGRKVVEIGAGTGTLTKALAAVASRLVAIEIDRHLVPVLESETASLDNVDVVCADATALEFVEELDGDDWVMVSNLPYNVGTGIVLDALRRAPAIDRFVVMVQKEVGERFLAQPGSKVYGVPSVIVGLHARGRIALRVPRHVFEPAPAVDSVVVVLNRVEQPDEAEQAIALAQAGFGQRRKMLRRSLGTAVDDPAGMLEAAGIDGTLRAEQLSPSDYVDLARQGEQG
ncbi:MAG: 16S rRNA (adenine(1518)-N(6)/adenine(1519)-N(6))-dimethyltransferase RsmA [Acidimicrobiia bacterium]